MLKERGSRDVCRDSYFRANYGVGVGGIVGPVLRVGGFDSESVFWGSGGHQRQGAVALDDIGILRDEDCAVYICEEVDVGEEGQVLSNDVDIVKEFVVIGGRPVVDVQRLGLREELLEI